MTSQEEQQFNAYERQVMDEYNNLLDAASYMMTLQEARQQLDVCEQQITGEYSKLLDAARNMGSRAVQAASKKTRGTFLTLLFSLYGLILIFASHPILGILLIIAGVVIVYNTHRSAASLQKKIETQVEYLNRTLDSNSKI